MQMAWAQSDLPFIRIAHRPIGRDLISLGRFLPRATAKIYGIEVAAVNVIHA